MKDQPLVELLMAIGSSEIMATNSLNFRLPLNFIDCALKITPMMLHYPSSVTLFVFEEGDVSFGD